MSRVITGDNTTPTELLRLIRQLDPGAVIAQKGLEYFLDSEARLVDMGHELIEIAGPVDAPTRTPADAIRLWWDIAVTDLSRASYLAYGHHFYRFGPLGLWEQLTQRTVEALEERRSTVLKEESELELKQDAAFDAEFDALIRRLETRDRSGVGARIAGLKLGGVIGVILALYTRKR